MPYGCGEQNMISMIQSVFILKYFTAIQTGNDVIKHKATRYIQQGYHQQLRYRHSDGSFSAFAYSLQLLLYDLFTKPQSFTQM